MSDTKSKNSPTHTAYQVREFKDKAGETQSSWGRVGSAWPHGDGQGFNITLNAFPVDGKIVLRPVKEKKTEDAGDAE